MALTRTVLLALSLMLPAAARAEPGDVASTVSAPEAQASGSFITRLAPPGSAVEHSQVSESARRSEAKGAVIRTQSAELGMAGLSLSILPDGDRLLTIDRATLIPRLPGAPKLSVANLSVVLGALPDDPRNHCSWLDAVKSLAADRFQIDRGSDGPDWTSLIGEAATFQSLGRGGCALGGRLSVATATAHRPDKASLFLEGVLADAWMPASVEAANRLQGPASLNLRLEEVEVSRAGEISSFGATGVDLSFRAEMGSLQAPLQLAGAANPYIYVWEPTALAMQAYNALLTTSSDTSLKASSMRIYPAGVMPAVMIRNFSRAGLSTITGTTGLDLAMRRGAARFQQRLAMTGIGEQSLEVELQLEPYSLTAIEEVLSGRAIGFRVFPEMVLGKADAAVLDRGFSSAAREITGFALATILADQQRITELLPEASDADVAELSGGLRRFSALLASGAPVELSYKPLEKNELMMVMANFMRRPTQLEIEVNGPAKAD